MVSDGRLSKLIRRRLLAFLIDYCIILTYTAVLVAVSLTFFSISAETSSAMHPLRGQGVGLITLTIPVFLYFYLSENGNYGATVGKRKMDIQVKREGGSVFQRNLLKFLPWEIAHTGVHWVVYYSMQDQEPPTWVFVVLVVPQALALVYLATIIRSKGQRGLYDQLAGTRVAKVE